MSQAYGITSDDEPVFSPQIVLHTELIDTAITKISVGSGLSCTAIGSDIISASDCSIAFGSSNYIVSIQPESIFRTELIDTIIESFFKTYSLNNLMKDIEKFTHNVTVPYNIKNTTYNAILSDHKFGYPNTHHQLTINFTHQKLRYSYNEIKEIEKITKTYDENLWIVKKEYIQHMTNLKDIAKHLNASIIFLFSSGPLLIRTFIEFINNDNKCILKLEFEYGESAFIRDPSYLLKLY